MMSPSLAIKLNANENKTAFIAHDDWNHLKWLIIAVIDKYARKWALTYRWQYKLVSKGKILVLFNPGISLLESIKNNHTCIKMYAKRCLLQHFL